jgi:hypothetical protein
LIQVFLHAAACKNTEKGESPVYIFVSGAFLFVLSKYWDTAARTYERIKSKNKNVSQFKNS